MTWFKRLATAVRTDAHGAVDVSGDETTLLKVHVRDAEEAVQRKRLAYAQLAAESTRLSAERTRACADCERFERDASLALSGDRRDLARYAVRLLLRRQRMLDTVDRRLGRAHFCCDPPAILNLPFDHRRFAIVIPERQECKAAAQNCQRQHGT